MGTVEDFFHSLLFSCYFPHGACSPVSEKENKSVEIGGGHWGLRYCSIGLFFIRYFGNLQYCGII